MKARHRSRQFISFVLFVLLLNLVLFGSALSQSQQGLTPGQVAKIKSVANVEIGPDGNNIAYTLRVQADPTKSNETASYHLYLYDREREYSTPYFTDKSVSSVAFRPGHNAITFLTRKQNDETTSLYQIALDGGEAQKLYSFETSIAGYDWAPDGNHLEFMASDPVKRQESDLPYKPENYEENLTQRRGFVTNVAMENHKPYHIKLEGSIYQMHWNPDGERLGYSYRTNPAR